MITSVPEIAAAPSPPKLQLSMVLAGLLAKATVAFGVSTRLPSLTSIAVKTDDPLVTEVTVKTTNPLAVETPEAAEIVSWVGRLETKFTVLPGTGLLFASINVTLIVVVAAPSAATDADEGVTLELAALTAAGLTVNRLVPVEPDPATVSVRPLPATVGVTLTPFNAPAVNAAEVPVTPAVPAYVTVPVKLVTVPLA